MPIDKTASMTNRCIFNTFYYKQARCGMHDIIEKMHSAGLVNHVYLPGYVGWSPREGSGIFDSIASVEGITMTYYRMTFDLYIDETDLYEKVDKEKSLVLLVNYFGFRDNKISKIIDYLKQKNVYIMEDNAHGFFTWHESKEVNSDIVVFSLHKMFPFAEGGSLVIKNPELLDLSLSGKKQPDTDKNPYAYRIHEISEIRRNNYKSLMDDLAIAEKGGYIESLRSIDDIKDNVPQTYPIRIKVGDRNRIYQIMNKAGFGVVSLYHTMIEPLQNEENEEAVKLSDCVMNLPVHQDVEIEQYAPMVDCLIKACRETEGNIND